MPQYDADLERYVRDTFAVEDEALAAATAGSLRAGLPAISIAPDEGRFLQLTCRLSGGREVCEIGTLGGYSTIWLARGLVPGGRLTTLELEPERAAVAKGHLAGAGVADMVDVVVGNARETMASVADRAPFDMVFIDADKLSYPDYFEWAVRHVRPGGVIAYHNAFREGAKIGADTSPEARTIVELSAQVAKDPRLISTIYPAGGGTLIAVKIGDA